MQKKITDSRGGVCFTDLMVKSAFCKHEHMKPACFLRAAGAGVGGECVRWGGCPWADRCPDSPTVTLTLAPAGSSTPPVPARVS